MCFDSMNTRKCGNLKDCSNGYHLKGTVGAKEDKKVKEPNKEKKNELEKEKETEKDDNNLGSFLGQILLQQQEMKTRQDQQWQQQQQMMQLFLSKIGGLDSRPSSPMQGLQGVQGMPGMLMPSMAQVVGGRWPSPAQQRRHLLQRAGPVAAKQQDQSQLHSRHSYRKQCSFYSVDRNSPKT